VRALALGSLILGALLPAPALAQAYQCSLPTRIEPVGPIRPEGPTRRTAIAGYTLAASWSPDYCKTSGDVGSMQCSGRNGRFGFVLHGLWPEGARGGPPPQWCGSSPAPSPQILRRNLCMTPSARLLAHEWAKHGSCMARTPTQYFGVGQSLWRSIRWPDADRISRKQGLTAGDLRRAFVVANPAWKVEQVGLQLSKTGWLREVQLCYSRRFLPVRCDKRHFGPTDATPIRIWRGL
jgi:ribonuclease T2